MDELGKKIDKIKDPMEWFDIVTFNYFVAGDMNNKIPVDWGRQRMLKFLEKHGLTKDNKS